MLSARGTYCSAIWACLHADLKELDMASGRQIAEHNVSIFSAWAASKSDDDFRRLIHRGALSRSKIAVECGFSKSALTQNPRIKSILNDLESRLRASGILPTSKPNAAPDNLQSSSHAPRDCSYQEAERSTNDATSGPTPTRALEAQLRRLQSENASQRAEIQELRRQLAKLSAIQEALATTGRFPR